MSYRETDDLGLDLDVYAEGDETTLRRDAPELDSYEEDDVATIPWIRRFN